MSAKAVKVPTVIANRTPTTASRRADTQVKRHDGVDKQAQGPISTSVVQRGDGTVSGWTGGRKCNNGAGQPHEEKDATQDKDFPPLSEELPWISLRPKAFQIRKNKRLYMEGITSRQGSRSRSEIRPDRHKIPGDSTLRLMPIASLCSISMFFHRWKTGCCLGNFFMHTTLMLYL